MAINFHSPSEDITATSVGTCERGTARGEGFRFDGDDRYTKCKPCGSGYYQNATGMGTCKAVPPGYVASTEREYLLRDFHA